MSLSTLEYFLCTLHITLWRCATPIHQYTCGVHCKSVWTNQKGLLCDSCDKWFHINFCCVNVSDKDYTRGLLSKFLAVFQCHCQNALALYQWFLCFLICCILFPCITQSQQTDSSENVIRNSWERGAASCPLASILSTFDRLDDKWNFFTVYCSKLLILLYYLRMFISKKSQWPAPWFSADKIKLKILERLKDKKSSKGIKWLEVKPKLDHLKSAVLQSK